MREERALDNTDTCALREAHVGAMEASDKDIGARPHVGAVKASEDALGPEMELALSTSCGDAPCKRRRPARTQRVRRLERARRALSSSPNVGAMEASGDALGPEMERTLSTSCVDAPCKRRRPARTQRVRRLERARRALSSSPALEEAGMCEERVLDSTDTCTMREAHASDNYALRESHVSAMEASEVEESSASSDAESGSSFCTMAIEQQVTVWLGELVSAVITVIADL